MLKILESYDQDCIRDIESPTFVFVYITSSQEFELYQLFLSVGNDALY